MVRAFHGDQQPDSKLPDYFGKFVHEVEVGNQNQRNFHRLNEPWNKQTTELDSEQSGGFGASAEEWEFERKEIILKEKTCGEVLLAQINNIIDVS